METRIALIKELGIFSCCELEYLERSKEHFCKLAEKIEKNEHIFRIINGALQREETLQRILVTPEDTVLYLEK